MFWDNRGLIHRAGSSLPGEPSKSYRIGVYDSLPFYVEAVPAAAGSRRS
jgi:taurine dioxygenase